MIESDSRLPSTVVIEPRLPPAMIVPRMLRTALRLPMLVPACRWPSRVPLPASIDPIEVPACTTKSPVKPSAEMLPILEADETPSCPTPSMAIEAIPATRLVLESEPR